MRADPSGWQVRLDDALIATRVAAGEWRNLTLVDHARQRVAEDANAPLLIDGGMTFSRRMVFDDARRLAASFQQRGLKPGDVISFQLPNWHEAAVIILAAAMAGLVINPLVPIYRDAEVGFMMRDCRSRMLFVPETFRRYDFPAMVARLRPDLPDLAEVVVVRGEAEGCTRYAELLDGGAGSPQSPPVPLDPNAVKMVLYTSGTTGRPKGVLHSSNTIGSELATIGAYWRVEEGDVIIMASPVTHITGFIYGLELPWSAGVPAVLMDIWEAGRAIELIGTHRCTVTVGATPFLQELLDAADRQGTNLPGFRLFACGGAAVPPELIRRAFRVLRDGRALRIYGSTELPTATAGVRSRAQIREAAETDGEIYGCEMRILDPETGAILPTGAEGEIVMRGPELMLGYLRTEDNADAFDAEGFFRTGDLGRIDSAGYLTVTGRKKDLIIRGGENIAPKEIEDALHRHPGIHEAAAVSMPHARLGETVCAYVILADLAAPPTLPQIAGWLQEAGLAKQKYPERIEIVDDLPRTASGKVKKDILRRMIAQKLVAEAEGAPGGGSGAGQ